MRFFKRAMPRAQHALQKLHINLHHSKSLHPDSTSIVSPAPPGQRVKSQFREACVQCFYLLLNGIHTEASLLKCHYLPLGWKPSRRCYRVIHGVTTLIAGSQDLEIKQFFSLGYLAQLVQQNTQCQVEWKRGPGKGSFRAVAGFL
jgi:hypothetical protein